MDSFALTANNVTYAASGDVLKYWRFFPVDDAWGLTPVWGFGTVTESRAEGVVEGERVYGFLPMASALVTTGSAPSSSSCPRPARRPRSAWRACWPRPGARSSG